jgi:predicted ATPase
MKTEKSDSRQKCLKRIKVNGYKSILKMDLNLNALNVIIGSNGSGKSNFLSVFTLLNHFIRNQLEDYISKEIVGAHRIIHFNLDDEIIEVKLEFNNCSYLLSLARRSDDQLYVTEERFTKPDVSIHPIIKPGNSLESELKYLVHQYREAEFLLDFLGNINIYHFFDTSILQNIKFSDDYLTLDGDANNLASVLNKIQRHDFNSYERIIDAIRLIAPYFQDFVFQMDPYDSEEKSVQFRWRQKGCFDDLLLNQMSDGLIRFICLTTLLLQPYPPPLILIDEPELGLHPHAISLLAGMLRAASSKSQIIVATQSVTLVNQFQADDIVIVEREGDQSVFKRVDSEKVKSWLEEFEEYGMGDLWEKNIIGGST